MLNDEQDLRIIQEKVEGEHQRLLSIEGAVGRAERRLQAVNGEITQKTDIVADLDKSISDLSSLKETIKTELLKMQEEKSQLAISNLAVSQELSKTKAQIVDETEKHNQRKEVLSQKEQALVSRETAVNGLEKMAIESHKKAEEKHEKIKQFIATL